MTKNQQKFMLEVSTLMKEHNLTADWWTFVEFVEKLTAPAEHKPETIKERIHRRAEEMREGVS